MTERASEIVVAAVRSALAAELGFASAVMAVTTPASSEPVEDGITDAVARHRVEQILAPHAEALGLSPAISDRLRQAHRQSKLNALMSVADTIHVSTTLAAAGIQHLALKVSPSPSRPPDPRSIEDPGMWMSLSRHRT